MKRSLEPPDSIHLEAAEGWIGLGDYSSAAEELESITAANHTHPDVLQLRWRISAEADDWVACLGIAASLTTMNPKHLLGWIHRAKSLHQLGRTQEAKDLLISVVDDFQSNPASFDAILLRVGSGGGSAPLAGEGRSGGV